MMFVLDSHADFLTACFDDDRFEAVATTISLGFDLPFCETTEFLAADFLGRALVALVGFDATTLVRSDLAFAMICVFRFGGATDLLFVERVAVALRGDLEIGDAAESVASSSMPKIAPRSSPTSVLSPDPDNSLSRLPSATACVTSS